MLRVFPTQQSDWESTYTVGARINWWSFSSTTKSGNGAVLTDPMFFGEAGQRMLFVLHCVRGIDISAFSDFPQEDEVLLMPGATLEVTQVVPAGLLGGAAMVVLQQVDSADAPAAEPGAAAEPEAEPAPAAGEEADPPASFVCAFCTLVNSDPAATVCAACAAPRPATEQAAQQPEAQLALSRNGAAALTSLHPHPVRNVAGSREWVCDVCSKACVMGRDRRCRCGVCADFDACAACHEKPHDHALKLVTVSAEGVWFCDECRTRGRPLDAAAGADAVEPLRRFRCYDCDDFDLCGNCVSAHFCG